MEAIELKNTFYPSRLFRNVPAILLTENFDMPSPQKIV